MLEAFRAFFAVALPVELQEQIMVLLKPLKRLNVSDDIRWSKPENLHITLRFLGNINIEQYNAIVAQAMKVLCEIPIFTVDLTSLCLFPNLFSPHALILKPQPFVKLKELETTIDKIVVANGVEPETRPFMPHLTVARFNRKICLSSKEQKNLTLDSLLGMNLLVNEVILYRSIPDRLGSQYIELNKFVLHDFN